MIQSFRHMICFLIQAWILFKLCNRHKTFSFSDNGFDSESVYYCARGWTRFAVLEFRSQKFRLFVLDSFLYAPLNWKFFSLFDVEVEYWIYRRLWHTNIRTDPNRVDKVRLSELKKCSSKYHVQNPHHNVSSLQHHS